MAPPFIAAYSAEYRAGHECADERFGHDNSGEKKRAAEAEIDQTGDETAPVTRELFANQKDKCNGGYDRQRNGQPGRCLIHAENFVRSNDKPVEQWRFLQARYAVVRWKQPVMARHHLARCSGVLAFGFAVEVPGPNGHDM